MLHAHGTVLAWIVFQVFSPGAAVSAYGDAGLSIAAVVPPLMTQEGRVESAAGGMPIYREPGSSTSKFYCNDRIVEPRDTMAGVIEKCGEPVRKELRREDLIEAVTTEGDFVTRSSTEVWTYNFGPDRLLYFLKFRDNTLVEIRTGEYGH